MKSYKEKLPAITTFIFDIDGVFTTGEVFVFNGEFVRNIQSKDAYALQYAKKMGFQLFIITGGESLLLKQVLENLGITNVYLKSANKLIVYEDIKKKYNLKDEEILYMGDDIPDYKVLERCGVSSCPQDAAIEIKIICDYQSPLDGGKCCVRDVIEQTMKVQQKWFTEESFIW
jgi:3-deoxy-D-manno-octulosonate 8-phosphate phosphatase (KDO 8-P phosphatase)